jgi:hypothetical protein
MTLAKAKARANETFIVQASLTIIMYGCQNIFIIQATELVSLFCGLYYKHFTMVKDDSRVISK